MLSTKSRGLRNDIASFLILGENRTHLTKQEIDTVYSRITIGNDRLILYTDPMAVISSSTDVSDKTSEYILYNDELTSILSDSELKYINNTSGLNKFTITNKNGSEKVDSAHDYNSLYNTMKQIRNTVSTIYNNSKVIEQNFNMIKDNFADLFTANNSTQSSSKKIHSFSYSSNNVPNCIRFTLSAVASNQIVNIIEYHLSGNTVLAYNFEQYKAMNKIIYIPLYSSPIQIDVFVTQYDEYSNSSMINSTITKEDYNIQK